MQIKSVIINNIHYINFITNISILFLSGFVLLKLECVLYTRMSYMPSNTVVILNSNTWKHLTGFKNKIILDKIICIIL